MDDSPKGERTGTSESIEVQMYRCTPSPSESKTRKITQTVPGGNRTHI